MPAELHSTLDSYNTCSVAAQTCTQPFSGHIWAQLIRCLVLGILFGKGRGILGAG